jgi:PKD domain
MDAFGNVYAVWVTGSGVNVARRARGASGWGETETVSSGGGTFGAPAIAVGAKGDVVVAWFHSLAGSNTLEVITRSGVSGPWSSVAALGLASTSAPSPAVAANGDAVVVWRETISSVHTMKAVVRRGSNGPWSAPQAVSGVVSSDPPVSGISPGGAAAVCWKQSTGVAVAVLPSNAGAWLPSQQVHAAATGCDIAVDAAGVSHVVSRPGHASPALVSYSWVSSDGVVSAPEVLSAAPGGWDNPRVGVSADGHVTALWSEITGGRQIIHTASRPPGSGWGPVQALLPSMNNSYVHELEVDSAGRAVAVWEQGTGAIRADSTDLTIWAAVRAAAAEPWGNPVQIAAPGPSPSYFPQVAVGAKSDAVAVWQQRGPVSTWTAQWTALDASGPDLDDGEFPTQGVAGLPLAFTVRPLDVWSPLAGSPGWSFGDGTRNASGDSVTHAFGAPGTYTVTLTQNDSLGNAGARSWPVVISAAPGSHDDDGDHRDYQNQHNPVLRALRVNWTATSTKATHGRAASVSVKKRSVQRVRVRFRLSDPADVLVTLRLAGRARATVVRVQGKAGENGVVLRTVVPASVVSLAVSVRIAQDPVPEPALTARLRRR